MEPLSRTLHDVMHLTWPMILISCIIVISLRITYLYRNKIHFTLYKELLMLSFIIYIVCLFQVVTFQDVAWSGNNFIPFKEMTRYPLGSRLFFKNVLGNMIMFMPYGFFCSYYLKLDKKSIALFLITLVSVSIELTQLAIGRVFDVDDIILNMIGGMLGYFIYVALEKLGNYLPKVFKTEWFLNTLSLLILLGIVCML